MNGTFRGNLKRAGALSLAFLLPGSGASMAQTMSNPAEGNAQPGHTYWKYDGTQVVLDLWECPETKLCAKIHSVDVHDPGAIAMAKFLWQRDGKIGHPVGPVSDSEVSEVCGYPQVFRDMKLKSGSLQESDFKIGGSAIYHALIDRPDNSGTSNGVTIERQGSNMTITTHVRHIPFPPFVYTEKLKLVTEPAAACTPPLPHLIFK